jgi:DNA anti-recombination protein RmuC
MFNDTTLDEWLDTRAKHIISTLGEGQPLAPEQLMVLVLKAQTNHFNHLDVEMRHDMTGLRTDVGQLRIDMGQMRTDISADMKQMRTEFSADIKQMRTEFSADMKQMRTDFSADMKQMREETNKRFETLITRIDTFMVWSFGLTLTVGALVVTAIKLL